jgi:hypothetical protein
MAWNVFRSLIMTGANRAYLRKLLGLTIQPDLPPNLRQLLKDLDVAEASRGSASRNSRG